MALLPPDDAGDAANEIQSDSPAHSQVESFSTPYAGATAVGDAAADPLWGSLPVNDIEGAVTFGDMPASAEEPDMWSSCDQAAEADAKARIPPYCECVVEHWENYVAAWKAGDAEEMQTLAEAIAKGFLSFVVSNKKDGTLWRKAREAEKKAGVSRAYFDLSLESREADADTRENCDVDLVETQESHYGETLLQAYLSSPHADVHGEGWVKYADLEREVAAMATRLEALEMDAKPVIAEALCMRALAGVLLLMIDAAEIGRSDLRAAGQRVLRFLAEHAKPREVDIMIKDALSMVSPRYKTQVLRLISAELMLLWGTAIPKITGKRWPFLKEMSAVLNVTMFAPDKNLLDEDATADGLSPKRRPATEEVSLLRCLQTLAADLRQKSEERRLEEESMRLAHLAKVVARCVESDDSDFNLTDFDIFPEAIVTFFRNGPPQFAASATDGSPLQLSAEQEAEKADWNRRKAEHIAAVRQILDEQEQQRDDIQTERGHVLSLLLNLVEVVASRLCVPAFDEHGLISNAGTTDTALVTFLKTTMPVFKNCGFDNPVDACQQGLALLGLTPISDSSGLVADVAQPQTRRSRKHGSHFAARSLGCYMMAALGCGKSNLVADNVVSEAGFGLLNGVYAVELTLPIVMALLSACRISPALPVFAAQLLDSLLCNVAEGLVASKADATRCVYHMQFAGADGSWSGLVRALALAVPEYAEKHERAMMYGVLQSLLKRFEPTVRYAILEAVLMNTQHYIMVSQLITELKDAMNAIDVQSCRDGSRISKATADSYVSRFVSVVLARFLLPRKEYLSSLASVSSASNAAYFIALCDRRKLKAGDDSALRRARLQSLKDILELAKQAVEATAVLIQVDKQATGFETVGKEADVPEKELGEKVVRDMGNAQRALVAICSALDVVGDCVEILDET